MNSFPVTRITVEPDGRSTFREDSLSLESAGTIGLLSESVPTTALVLRANPPDYHYDWHCAPRKQFILMLTGEISIAVGTGETRTFSAGEVLFVEDTHGRGHKTWNSGGTWRLSAFVAAGDDIPFLGSESHDS